MAVAFVGLSACEDEVNNGPTANITLIGGDTPWNIVGENCFVGSVDPSWLPADSDTIHCYGAHGEFLTIDTLSDGSIDFTVSSGGWNARCSTGTGAYVGYQDCAAGGGNITFAATGGAAGKGEYTFTSAQILGSNTVPYYVTGSMTRGTEEPLDPN